ncbi:PAS domain S-box protein [Halomicroarcula sp. F13]|uniref:PAS domain S-box protein n=1 Tax=Haloarcula rubra TaxID=2487747 RepID=A0AAW4PVH4_9EURY|nr:bacterio-opsin activator domain-containing protein [Halomicroarcula rubra]MBX0324232.1 PAS domain S-box protein [Halomicroarcula rubra]
MSIDQEQSPLRLLYVGSGSLWSDESASLLADAGESQTELTVETAAAALELVEQQSLAAVVARYDLPDGDGVSFLSDCLDAQPGLVTILVAGQSSQSLIDRTFEAGIDEFVHDTGPEKRRLLDHHLRSYLGAGETTRDTEDSGRLLGRLQSETTLGEERSLTDRILETSPVGIVIVDADDTVRYINDRAADMLGIDGYDGPLVETALDVDVLSFDGDVEGDDRRPHQRVVEDGVTVRGEARVAVDGQTRWLSVAGAPLYDADGAVSSSVFSLEDVTDQKQRERRLQRQEAVMQIVDDGLYAVDDEGRFVAVNDAYTDLVGYDRETLLGRPASEFFETRLVEQADDLQSHIESDGRESVTLEAVLTTASGEQVPVEARISLFELDDGRHGRAGVVRDISDRKRRAERLASLNEVGQALTTAETAEAVADIVVEGAREILALPLTAVEYHDEATGRLRPARRTAALESLVGDGPLFTSEWGCPWQVYAESEGRVLDDLSETAMDADETPLESAILLPMGTHGVFVAGATEPHAFDDTDVMVAEILVANAVAALDRVDRERELRATTAELADHNESLHHLNRLNDIIRSLTRDLTQASTRADVETAVCERLADADPYVFAWVGEQRASSDDVSVRASSGDDDGYLDWLADAERPATGETPTERAISTREPVVQNSLHADPPLAPWQTQALRRGFDASIAVPLTFRETVYGVLHLYADEAGVFDEMERAVLGELGGMVGYAINAIERKKALVSDAAVELTFSVDDPSIPPFEFAAQTGSEFEFDELVQHSDGTVRVFFTVSGADPDAVYRYSERIPSIHQLSLLTEREDTCRFEALVGDSGFLADLVSYGAHPTAMTASADGGRVSVELPQSGDVQAFVRMFLERYEGSELVAKTERERSVQTPAEFEANYRDRLTERQREVLETAYFSGFFEWPRDVSGQELAAMLDVSQPTVSRHIRTGERELFGLIFDDEETRG